VSEKLPRGIWFDEEKKRYRVRRYRNGKPYLRYRRTKEAAIAAYDDLAKELAKIPKLSREQMKRGVVPKASFAGLAKAMRA
jgi:hypothetical protein